MSGSSGQLVTTTTRDVECDGYVTHLLPAFADGPKTEHTWACIFAGNVDVTVDPEAMWAGWDCPVCDKQHEVDWDEIVGGAA